MLAGRGVALSGSSSVMINAQVACWIASGAPACRVDVDALITDPSDTLNEIGSWVLAQESTATALVYATAEPHSPPICP